ncbi:hypothetical protein D4764_16G0004250, partial [Takifugu flavidus]
NKEERRQQTSSCTSSHQSVKLIKFADDTTLIGLISNGDETAYRREVARLVSWCGHNNRQLNAQKTVEMIVDFRKVTAPLPPLALMDSPITIVDSFRFLGTTITRDLNNKEERRQQTSSCTSSHQSVKLIKFTDDTTLIGLISNGDETAYRREVARLVSWCGHNNRQLNAQKTVEMIVDFRKVTAPLPPLALMDSPITIVDSFRFLGTTITRDLKWEPNIYIYI